MPPRAFGVEAAEIEPDPAFVGTAAGATAAAQRRTAAPTRDEPFDGPAKNARYGVVEGGDRHRSGRSPRRAAPPPTGARFDHSRYRTITTLDALDAVIAAATAAGLVALDTETTSLDPADARPRRHLALLAPGEACYIPIGHVGEGGGDLFGGADCCRASCRSPTSSPA